MTTKTTFTGQVQTGYSACRSATCCFEAPYIRVHTDDGELRWWTNKALRNGATYRFTAFVSDKKTMQNVTFEIVR